MEPRRVSDGTRVPGRPSWLDDGEDPSANPAANADGAGAGEEEEEEDYMSDAFLLSLVSGADAAGKASTGREQTFSHRRKKQQAQQTASQRVAPTGTLKEREEAARRRGLDTNLLAALDSQSLKLATGSKKSGEVDSAKNEATGDSSPGTVPSAAIRMMLAMGYQHGSALGVAQHGRADLQKLEAGSSSDPDDRDGAASGPPPRKRTRFSPSSETSPSGAEALATAAERDGPLTTPLQVDTSRADRKTSRVGLGHPSARASHLVSERIRAASRLASEIDASGPAREDVDAALSRFRSQTAIAAAERRVLGHLGRARRTTQELDSRQEIQWSTLWVDVAWCGVDAALPVAMIEIVQRELGVQGAEGRGELRRALVGDVVHQQREKGIFEADDEVNSSEDGPEKVHSARREELRLFCALDAPTRLELTLTHLRSFHHYCLYCGTVYNDQQDLAQHCPGENEDDHD